MGIFLDSGFYCGLIDLDDQHSEQAMNTLKMLKSGKYGHVYTSNYIMAESATLIASRTNRNPIFMREIEDLFIGEKSLAVILKSSFGDEKEAWNLFQKLNSEKKREKIVSFIDCTNIVLSQNHQIKYIATYDPHFEGWITVIS